MSLRPILVTDYDPAWPVTFEKLRKKIWPAVKGFAKSIEHVGSTAVPGLAAKPIIDMTIIVSSPAHTTRAVKGLASLKYEHLGDLGIQGREAFRHPKGQPDHNLYVCLEGSLALVNHLAVRDYLRAHPEVVQRYGALKRRLAREFPHDINRYVEGKTDLLAGVLRQVGLSRDQLMAIEDVNTKLE